MLAVHKYLSHDIECAYCKQACEGQCPKYFGEEIEKVGGKRMEATRQAIMKMVSSSEDRIKESFSNLQPDYTTTLERCAYYIDVGMTNCVSTSLAMLIYYPNPELPEGLTSEFSKWYVQQNIYTDALIKLEKYLGILSYIGIEVVIDRYRDSCPQFFTESDKQTYKVNCHPQREVYCEASNRLEQTLPEAKHTQ